MDKELKLYSYIDGVNDIPFPSSEDQAIITSFKYDSKRMGGAPTISATLMHVKCLDKLWEYNVYATFNGEKYFIKNIPSSSYNNTDILYKHDIELVSERIVLDNVYFYDVVSKDVVYDKPVSNNSKFTFFGDIHEFASRLNYSLQYSKMDYTVVVDDGISSEGKFVSFEDTFFSNAIQESYNTYEIPYYFDGKTIHFGFTNNAITQTFKYGVDESLLSIQKQNANYKVVNRVTGTGSSDNIPYYYPNLNEWGIIAAQVGWDKESAGYDWDFSRENELELKASDVVIVDEEKFATNISPDDRVICYGFKWYRNTINGEEILLNDIGIKIINHDGNQGCPNAYFWFGQKRMGYAMPVQSNLMPPIYRSTGGEERFYNALNNTYISPETGTYYEFENQYTDGKQKEQIVSFEDIKPSIVGMTNANGKRIDTFLEFAYDENDNDETDEEGNYLHPYFFAKLPKYDGTYGFNLFDHAIDEEEMTISMTSGNCGACEWTVMVDSETLKNTVQVDSDGNLLRDKNGNVSFGAAQDKQNDTINNEVWIALKKDIDTFGVVMPNVTNDYKPSAGDTFVILHILLPNSYIFAAENRLKEELIKYMAANNSEKFNFSIAFSRIYFAENPDVLDKLNENARIQIEYNGELHELYVSSFAYSMDSGSPLPNITVELSDTLTIQKNALQTAISQVENSIMKNIGSIDWLKLGLAYFLRKDTDDRSRGKVASDKGFEAGKFKQGSDGAAVYRDGDGNWHIETDYMDVRMKVTTKEVEIQRVYHIAGAQMKSAANMRCIRVVELEDVYRCYMQITDSDGNRVSNDWRVNDQAYVQTFNLVRRPDGTMGNHFLWRLVTAVGEDYIDLSRETAAMGSDAPMAGDDIVQLGYRGTDDAQRQTAVIDAGAGVGAPYYRQFTGIDSFTMTEPETQLQPGDNILSGVLHIKQGSTGAANLADLPDFVLKAQQMGTVNLLRNSGFTGDYQTEELSAKGRLTGDTVMYSKPLEYWTGTATASEDILSASGVSVAIGSLSQDVKLMDGEVYAVSYKAKGERITVSCGEYIHTDALDTDYRTYRHSFTFTGMHGITFDGVATVCEIQLERGSIATDWHPSPMDVDKSAAGLQSLQYLADAIKNGSVNLLGGLVLASMIQLGNYSNGTMKRVTAGMSGIYNDDDDVYTWGGGSYEQAIRAVMMFKRDPSYQPSDEELQEIAKAVITHGGRAILNDVVLRGYIYALGGLFKGTVSIAGGKILLNEDGSGQLADGTIRWDTYGNLYQKSRSILVWRDIEQEMYDRGVTGDYDIDLKEGTYIDITCLATDSRVLMLPPAESAEGIVIDVRHGVLTRTGGTYRIGCESGGVRVYNQSDKAYDTVQHVTLQNGWCMEDGTIESVMDEDGCYWYAGNGFTETY